MDKDLPIAKITFELPRRDVPELMVHLGNFALEHNIDICIRNAPAEVEHPGLRDESHDYNPDFAVLLPADEEDLIPVVTKKLLDNYAQQHGKVGLAPRLLRQLGYASREDVGLQKMLYGRQGPYGNFEATGIKVSHIRTLHHLLDEGDLQLRNVGKETIGVLSAYCTELFPDDIATQD
ncbi:MAG TPA: hypothetical protein VK983_00015 [Candidatus Limnocylindrales bacterium]|nr:hypothetical protein [Candidatus Limnocylindrales bacterium]